MNRLANELVRIAEELQKSDIIRPTAKIDFDRDDDSDVTTFMINLSFDGIDKMPPKYGEAFRRSFFSNLKTNFMFYKLEVESNDWTGNPLEIIGEFTPLMAFLKFQQSTLGENGEVMEYMQDKIRLVASALDDTLNECRQFSRKKLGKLQIASATINGKSVSVN